ncbi:MAG: hypothetical protein AB7V19_07530 [Candidatus Bipolaricaulia bacterium]
MTGEERDTETPIAAVILSVLGGVWMVATGTMYGGWHMGSYGSMSWMWGHGMMGGVAATPSWWPWLGVVAGGVVLLGAIMAYVQRSRIKPWGIVILVASAVNLFFGMGGLLASALGITGGALVLTWGPE